MTVPLWVLLFFAVWTIVVLLSGVAVHRWSMILSRRAGLTDFPADRVEGPAFYRRAMRAHANCVENLPVYAALALLAAVTGVETVWLDRLALAVMAGRIGQSVTHMAFTETDRTVAVRFSFFTVQVLAMLAMAALIAWNAVG